MNYSNLYLVDTINGDGLRVSLFVSGCTIHCKGCFNKETWNFKNGNEFTDEIKNRILDTVFMKSINYQGLSILGGEPLDNINGLTPLLDEFIKRNENLKKDVWIWSGYTIDQINKDPKKKEFLLKYANKGVIGPFIEEQKDLTLRYRGSTNQHVFDINKCNGTITINENY